MRVPGDVPVPRAPRKPQSELRLSIVIPAVGSSVELDECVASLRDAATTIGEKGLEILVVGPGPSDARTLPPGTIWIEIPSAADERAAIWSGLERAGSRSVCVMSGPGLVTPRLVRTALEALDAYPRSCVVARTFVRPTGARSTDPEELIRQAMGTADPRVHGWLDLHAPIGLHFGSIDHVRSVLAGDPDASEIRMVRLIGDAVVIRGQTPSSPQPLNLDVNPALAFFGSLDLGDSVEAVTVGLEPRRERPSLSMIVVIHEMERVAPRTIRSLCPDYQTGVIPDEYEIIVVDNGSSRPMVDPDLEKIGPNVQYHHLADGPPSPARAINFGVEKSKGDVLGIMIDGACLLTPGVIGSALQAFMAFASPIVATRYFYLGPGCQNDTILSGYGPAAEDALLDGIGWPREPYRLFEIGSPITLGGPLENWFTRWFESNCMFMDRTVFSEIGGCDERFQLPGGGGLLGDLFIQSLGLARTQLVQLVGEGTFHQVHGGVTTNASHEDRSRMLKAVFEEYAAIRGGPPQNTRKRPYYLGRLPNGAARFKMGG